MNTDSLWATLRVLRLAAPKVARYLVYLLFLVNPSFQKTMFMSHARKIVETDKWRDSITPVGANPLAYTVTYKSWASLDDCDFYGHMSNSSYAKPSDAARFKYAIATFPMLFHAKGWIALGATHYSFVREIPMLASYEVRVRIGTWDHKWMYVVAKFVTKSKRNRKQKDIQPRIATPSAAACDDDNGTGSLLHPSVDGVSSTAISTPNVPALNDTGDTSQALKAVAETLANEPEEDGAILHAVSVTLNCFKIGRITIPPALVFAINGFSAPPPPYTKNGNDDNNDDVGVVAPEPYSRTNPPPHWRLVGGVMSPAVGGSSRALRDLLKGGWKDVPEGDARWWDVAMGGVLEEQRRRQLDLAQGLNTGLGFARNV